MNQQALKKLLSIFVRFKDADDSELCSEIMAAGVEMAIAERMCAFLPSAFCRVVISHEFEIEFSETFSVEGVKKSFWYNEEPIYTLAIEVAVELYHADSANRSLINCVMERSAEYNAINQALNSGEVLKGSKFSEIKYFGYKTLGKRRSLLQRLFC